MTTSKPVNPLLPFVLCATSMFADDVDVTAEDEEFRQALHRMARVEEQLGRGVFEQILAAVATSVSEVAWAQLLEAAEAVEQLQRKAASLH